MKCPHCSISFHENWQESEITRDGKRSVWSIRLASCPTCKKDILELGKIKTPNKVVKGDSTLDAVANFFPEIEWRQVFPLTSSRGPAPQVVPQHIAKDYTEACGVLPISPKAAAALARRCLQAILHEQGYKDRDLAKEIDLVLNENDPSKALPHSLRDMIDGVRNFGNFSAHPVTDKTSLQVIDVEPHEAEWCLEIIEEMFQHFYVHPALRAKRKAELNAKLQAAGKPLAK
jgi:hypothetical protein